MQQQPRVRNLINKRVSSGFTLVELLVFITIFSIGFTLIIATITYTSIGLRNSIYKTSAIHYTEELAEWVRYKKELSGFDSLFAEVDNTYCFNDALTDDWPTSPGACAATDYSLGNFFKREMELTGDADQVQAIITTYWSYLGTVRTSELIVYISDL